MVTFYSLRAVLAARCSTLLTVCYFVVAMPLNCSGMYRGVIKEDGTPKTAIFDDDELD